MATIRRLRGRWQAQVRRRGMKPRAKSFDTKTEAERWARDLESQADRFGAAPDTRILESTTVKQLLLRYRDEVTPSKRGAEQERQRLNWLCHQDLAHRTLIGISPSDIASYRDERLAVVSPATVTREIAILSHVLEVAIRDWGYPLASNAVKRVRRPKVANARNRRLVGNEEDRLLDGCDAGQIPWLRALVVVAIETGMRRGELLALRWADIDLSARTATLRTSKNGTGREIPLSMRAFEVISGLARDGQDREQPLFPTTAGALEQTWRRLCARVDVVGLRFHDLRHEAVSRLFERGLNVVEVASISGHKELRMLGRYTHLRAKDLVSRLG
ncbi:integrase [Zhengella mangrovi]|uniref:Integrase n=1 Tax=Zhengella mangrovi TaxID=1982044 RepID=A0A2G1QK27_9HYPH|nr:site-specific integrase [Zhengella mangrovi]PHP65885.1 integrase [Zhengella mangrovi]